MFYTNSKMPQALVSDGQVAGLGVVAASEGIPCQDSEMAGFVSPLEPPAWRFIVRS